MSEAEIPVARNETEGLIPNIWRPTFLRIVDAFVEGDYALLCGVEGVVEVSNETVTQIKEYIEDYGETLVNLSDETWKSSVCIWTGHHWDVLIDLWTAGEGRSDLVLSARVLDTKNGFIIDIYMVYVP